MIFWFQADGMPVEYDEKLPVSCVEVAVSEDLVVTNKHKKANGKCLGAVGDFVEWNGQRIRNFKRFKKVSVVYI
jgi:hypothetical protein